MKRLGEVYQHRHFHARAKRSALRAPGTLERLTHVMKGQQELVGGASDRYGQKKKTQKIV